MLCYAMLPCVPVPCPPTSWCCSNQGTWTAVILHRSEVVFVFVFIDRDADGVRREMES
jgi:hypothetical protein